MFLGRIAAAPLKAELEVTSSGLAVGDGSVDMTLYRYCGAAGLNVERRSGKLDVAMLT